MSKFYYVVAYDSNNKFEAVISGLGRNKNTLDSSLNTIQTARKHAKNLAKNKNWPGYTFKIETNTINECFGEYKNKFSDGGLA